MAELKRSVLSLQNVNTAAPWLNDFATDLPIDTKQLISSTLDALGKLVDVIADVGEALPYVGAAFKLLKLVRTVVKQVSRQELTTWF